MKWKHNPFKMKYTNATYNSSFLYMDDDGG